MRAAGSRVNEADLYTRNHHTQTRTLIQEWLGLYGCRRQQKQKVYLNFLKHRQEQEMISDKQEATLATACFANSQSTLISHGNSHGQYFQENTKYSWQRMDYIYIPYTQYIYCSKELRTFLINHLIFYPNFGYQDWIIRIFKPLLSPDLPRRSLINGVVWSVQTWKRSPCSPGTDGPDSPSNADPGWILLLVHSFGSMKPQNEMTTMKVKSGINRFQLEIKHNEFHG